MTAIYSFYIINKSGSVIFYKDYGSAGRMDTNDRLRLASMWHSMHAISQQLSPVSGCSGIELLQMKPLEEYYMHHKKLLIFEVAAVPGDSWKGLLAALQLQNILRPLLTCYINCHPTRIKIS